MNALPPNMAEVKSAMRRWLVASALPLWASMGRDLQCGGFVERLQPDGTPDLTAPKRIVVQARQVFVYSHAAFHRLTNDAIEAAEAGFRFIQRHGPPDGMARGFVHSVARDGAVIDRTRDAYDHAFLILAFSWYYRASGEREALDALRYAVKAIDRLRVEPYGSIAEADVPRFPRRQNPHMHVLEAYMAAYEATGREEFLNRAREIVSLLSRYFFDSETGGLYEYFGTDLTRLNGPVGKVIEPGHHYEWVWLLAQYGRLSGKYDMTSMHSLYQTAQMVGVEPTTGLVYDEVDLSARTARVSKRLWPQTEALKAHCQLGDTDVVKNAWQNILRFFSGAPLVGTWVDRLDANNAVLSGPIPASSLYHIHLALTDCFTLTTQSTNSPGSGTQG